jgi:hypothetical protein
VHTFVSNRATAPGCSHPNRTAVPIELRRGAEAGTTAGPFRFAEVYLLNSSSGMPGAFFVPTGEVVIRSAPHGVCSPSAPEVISTGHSPIRQQKPEEAGAAIKV